MCRQCALIKKGFMSKDIKVPIHGCKLSKNNELTGWKCDSLNT